MNSRIAAQGDFRSRGVVYRRATKADDAELRALLHDNDMDSWVNLCFEREPSYFDGESLMGESTAVIALDESTQNSPVGMYSCSFFPVHINGQPGRTGYLGGLRVDRKYRRRVRILKDGFASIPALLSEGDLLPLWFTSVGEDNGTARRILEADLAGMPRYGFRGAMDTLAFSIRQRKNGGLLQRATIGDIPALVAFYNQQACAFQLSPVMTESWLSSLDGKHGLCLDDFWLLKDRGEIQGCLAIWDQRKFKQTTIRGYRFPLNRLRGVYNLYAAARSRIMLPAPGEKLEQVFMSFFALDKCAQNLAVDVVKEGLLRVSEKNALVGILGLSDRNPLTDTLKSRLHPDCYRTRIETVIWPGEMQPDLDSRPVQPEVAVL